MEQSGTRTSVEVIRLTEPAKLEGRIVDGCDMGGVAQAENHDGFIVNLEASKADTEEIVPNCFGRRTE